MSNTTYDIPTCIVVVAEVQSSFDNTGFDFGYANQLLTNAYSYYRANYDVPILAINCQILPPFSYYAFEKMTGADAVVKDSAKHLVEMLTSVDTAVKQMAKRMVETATVYDDLVQNAANVLFDILIRNVSMTDDDFLAAVDQPPLDYDAFVEYHPGDYEYQNAIVGVRVEQKSNNGKVGIVSMVHNVDVPDVTDKGQAAPPGGSGTFATVTFARAFYTAPTVTATWIGGPSVATAEVFNVTKTGFSVRLWSTGAVQNNVSGTVSWNAQGY